VNRQVLEELKRQIPLLEYLQTHDWQPARALNGGRWMGLCPLHTDHKPSLLVDPNKGLFYCYGCGRGGDVIRFAELYHQVNFPQAVTLLRQWCGLAPLLNAVIDFYRIQLYRYNEAIAYLDQRGVHSSEVIEHMRIGYAPGACLRSWLTQLGYPLSVLRQAGLVNAAGYDSYIRRIVFPLDGNLYGRSVRSSSSPHLFMPGSKGGLYLWEHVRRCPEVILVEGLFDYAVLWQARTVYITFDADANGSGARASQFLARRLWAQGVTVRQVAFPEGHDPNSFFVQGGDASQFQNLLQAALA
jgi:DNA primase